MYMDEVYLRRENELFVFDRREIRLFRIVRGERSEVNDRSVMAMIITSPAKVFSGDQIRFCVRQSADLAGV